MLQENIVEYKHHKLARSLRSGPTDRDLKPNAATRDQLNVINILLLYYIASVVRCYVILLYCISNCGIV